MIETVLAFCQLSRTTSFSLSWHWSATPSIIRCVSASSPPFPERSRFGSASDIYDISGPFCNTGFSTFKCSALISYLPWRWYIFQHQPNSVLELCSRMTVRRNKSKFWILMLNTVDDGDNNPWMKTCLGMAFYIYFVDQETIALLSTLRPSFPHRTPWRGSLYIINR